MLRANLSKLKKGIIRILEKDCFDPRTKEQYEEFINKEKAAKKEPAKRKRQLRRRKKKFLRPQPQTPNHRKLGRKSRLLKQIQKQKKYQQQLIYTQGQQKQMYKQQ